MNVTVSMEVNGRPYTLDVSPEQTLLQVLRDTLHLTGAKYGCGIGECGACTVLMDGKPILSCQTLAAVCNGRKITTIEGISNGKNMHPMQEAFVEEGAVQCGFCTPGMVVSAVALVNEKPDPTDDDIQDALRGNFCRCTGYENISRAVKAGAKKMKEGK